MDTKQFKAGASKVDITPPLGTLINGDFITHYARFIHDNLYAKALVMKKGEQMIAMVVVDICAMAKDFLDNVKSEINDQTGIRPENILISSTHTHASGSIASLLLAAADLPYRQKLSGLLVKVVQQAKQNLRPAKIGFGTADAPEHVVCRRYIMKNGYKAPNPVTGDMDIVKTNPFGDEKYIDHRTAPVDSEIGFLAVQGVDNEWISLLANYSLHYVGDWENGTITADYFGEFSRQIQEKLKAPDHFVGIMSNGTSGDANIIDYLNPCRYPDQYFAKEQLIAKELAQKVSQSLKDVEWQTDPELSSKYTELSVAVRKPSQEEIESAKKIVTETDFESITTTDSASLHNNPASLRKVYAREQILLNEYPDTEQLPLQAIRIGNGIIGTLGGEFFAETGLWLKKNKPEKNYFTIALANDCVGYVPPAHEIERGGYETWRCRSSHLEVNAEDAIKKELLKLIKQV